MLPWEYWIVVAVTVVAIVACVSLHYEGLRLIARIPIGGIKNRHRIIVMLLCVMLLHVVEVWIFGITYYLLLLHDGFGSMDGIPAIGVFDAVYFSATVFSTLGFGDIVPIGPIRFVTGTQSIAGLTLITWSASFTFIEMTQAGSVRNDR